MKGELTKEEIIEILNVIKFLIQSSLDEVDVDKDCKEAEENNKQIIVALDAAIEALEAEPCEDAVSRKALQIALLDEELDQVQGKSGRELCQIVEAFPPVQPKEKVGYWIDCKDSIIGDIIERHCSICGQMLSGYIGKKMKYCPNCGAKMKGESK